MTTLSWPAKDPDEKLDYRLNWSARLGVDTIVASIWTAPETIVIEDDSFTGVTTTVWLSGGVAEKRPILVTNRITTAGGRIMEQSVSLQIKEL
jgi:hypothetical protein